MTKTSDTETEANRQTMTETFEAWRDGAEPFPDTWATDMVWRIEGRSIASKEYASKHEYLEEFVKPFGARFLASERFRPTNIRSVRADGNTVIVLWDGRGIAIDGKPYENTYAFFMQMRDGKVVDVTASPTAFPSTSSWNASSPPRTWIHNQLGELRRLLRQVRLRRFRA
jgi:ketosteroid isomerase-like protein